MGNQQQILQQIKVDLFSLYLDTEHQIVNFNDFYDLFRKSMSKFFGIENSCFFVLLDEKFKLAENTENDQLKLIKFSALDVLPLFEKESIIAVPSLIKEYKAMDKFDQVMLFKNSKEEPFGIVLFQQTNAWKDFKGEDTIADFVQLISKIFSGIYSLIEVRANEMQYRKLYNMTDLFHSTMDIDVILENVLQTIEDNFPNFDVDLILSNDQDRQTKVHIKVFDYLSERPSTIEAFVSGELIEEVATDLNAKVINAPIKGRQAIYGILQVRSPIDYIFTKPQRNFIQMLAHASGNALENAKLYHQSHHLIADLQLINETSHRLNSNLSVEEMLTFLQKQLIKSFKPNQVAFSFKEDTYNLSDVATEFFQTKESEIYLTHVEKHFETSIDPLFIADFSRLVSEGIPFKSLMAIPMLVEEKINGYCIVLHEDSYFFSFDSYKLMQSLIHHSSLAISNSILRNRLQEMVNKDHLTKLYARRYLDVYVENSLQMDHSGMFMLIDIDNFKRVNDTYGHKIGDEILVQIASQLQKMIGTSGICARWGGEELAVYIPNVSQVEANDIAQEVIEAIPNITDPIVTISAGLVPWRSIDEPDFQTIFLQADTALYEAKKNGKNQYQQYNKSMQLQH